LAGPASRPVVTQAAEVRAVKANAVTLRIPGGGPLGREIEDYHIDQQTTIEIDGKAGSLADLKPGWYVVIGFGSDRKTVTLIRALTEAYGRQKLGWSK